MYYKKLKNSLVQCILCPHFCTLKSGEYGKCRTRKNVKGKLYALGYEKPVAIHVDPIEKKPLFHFLPGSKAFSIGTAGCNLTCKNCQNSNISQAGPDEMNIKEVKAKEIIKLAKDYNCKSIAYTYTEPLIAIEYLLDIAKLAKKSKIKNVVVSNGFINSEPLKQAIKYIDAANIDLKAMSDTFYKSICGARLQPVLDTIKTLYKEGVWIEITNLIIPGLNDKEPQLKKLINFIKDLSPNIPLHFSAFHPAYQLMRVKPTPANTLERARKLAMQAGLSYVYTGNLFGTEGSDTYCLKCKKLLIERIGFDIKSNKIKNNKCYNCNRKVEGVWT